MLKTVSSYYLPEYEKKCTNIIDYGNKEILNCNIDTRVKIIEELIKNDSIIRRDCCSHIQQYVNESRSIFNNKIKFSKKSLLLNNNVFLCMRVMYEYTSLKIELYLFNSIPHVMCNKEIFFSNYSLIKSGFKIFDLNTISKKFSSLDNLSITLFELFNVVYDNILYN